MVRVGDGSTQSPVSIAGRPIGAIRDTSDGSLMGLIMRDGSTLKEMGLDGTEGATIASYSSFANLQVSLSDNVFVLNVDGDLKAYDAAADHLSPLGHQVAKDSNGERKIHNAMDTGDELFWVSNDVKLYRTDVANSEVITLEAPSDVYSAFSNSQASKLAVGQDYGIWSYNRNRDGVLASGGEVEVVRSFSLSATGSDGATDALTVSGNDPILSAGSTHWAASDQWAFFTYRSSSGGLVAVAQKLDGSDHVDRSPGMWVGGEVDSYPGTVGPLQGHLSRVYFVSGLNAQDKMGG